MRLLGSLVSLSLISLAGYALWFFLSSGGNLPFGLKGIGETAEVFEPSAVEQSQFDEEAFKEAVVHVRALVGFCPIGLGNVDGTGFVLDRFRGLVVTAQHVVAGTCGEIATITILADPSFRTARIIAQDSTLDLAVLEVEEVRGLKDLSTSSAQEVGAGDMLCTASYVKGPQHPPLMTCGQFLGWGDCRAVEGLFFDTDVLPGHSGAPLVDALGQVVGVVIAGREPFFRGTASCAVPIEKLEQLEIQP